MCSPWERITSLAEIAQNAIAYAEKNGHNVVILDTAGRLHVDEDMMAELAGDQRNCDMCIRHCW